MLGCELLIILVLSGLLLIEALLGRIAVDYSWLTKRAAHLARNSHLGDILVRIHTLRDRCRHGILLRAHILLLLLLGVVGLALVHATSLAVLTLALIYRLTKLVHAMGIGAVVLVWASLACIIVLTHDCLVVFEISLAVGLILMASLSTLAASLEATTANSTSSAAGSALETIFIRCSTNAIHTTAHIITAILLLMHSTSAASAHLIITWATTLDEV